MGYVAGETESPGVTEEQWAIRLGRAMDGHIMRWLDALLHASQALGLLPTQGVRDASISPRRGSHPMHPTHPTYTKLHYAPSLHHVVNGDDQLFGPGTLQPREAAREVIAALLAAEM